MADQVTEIEGTFKVLLAGPELYTKTWMVSLLISQARPLTGSLTIVGRRCAAFKPKSQPVIAKLVFFHGFSDHVGRYYDLFPSLARRGVAVFGVDQRGWGRSALNKRDWGMTGPTATVLADMIAFIRHVIDAKPDDVPLFVMGHSMGGGQVLNLMCDACVASSDKGDAAAVAEKVRGWILESAFVAFAKAEQPSSLKIWLGKLAMKLLPHFQLKNPIAPERLSRDPEVQRSLRDDPLLHDTGTLEGYGGLIERTERLARAALGTAVAGHVLDPKRIRSVFMAHGTNDMVCDFDTARRFFEAQTGVSTSADRKDDTASAAKDKGKKAATQASPGAPIIPDATWSTFDGFYHQLHSDVGRERFYREVGDWIVARAGKEEVGQPAPAVGAASASQPEAMEQAEQEQQDKEASAAAEAAEPAKDGSPGAKL